MDPLQKRGERGRDGCASGGELRSDCGTDLDCCGFMRLNIGLGGDLGGLHCGDRVLSDLQPDFLNPEESQNANEGDPRQSQLGREDRPHGQP